MYTEHDLVRIAKRENNSKRNYLVVNRLQGKHIPVAASEAFSMFYELGDMVLDCYKNERLLVIGFAETATAIGSAVAHRCKMPYMQTTREEIEHVSYLYFSEEHSHATEQKLVKDDIDKIYKDTDRIVFVEDEVTTGKTILNIIDILNKKYPSIEKYSVASLLNGMNEDAVREYEKRKIALHYLVKTDHSSYGVLAESFSGDGRYMVCKGEDVPLCNEREEEKEIEIHTPVNPRRLTEMKDYDTDIEKLWNIIKSKVDISGFHSILVIGTEEFMYPALRIARFMEAAGKQVKCHSTTRSPIVVSTEASYPLHARYELQSLYDKNRKTFLYDIEKADCVFLVTDAPKEETAGLASLKTALKSQGNNNIYVVRWCLQ